MSLKEAIDGIKREAAEIADTVRDQILALDFRLDFVQAVRDKYDLISQDVLGLSYEKLGQTVSLPPVDPDDLFDRKRLGLVDITAMGDVFFPSQPSIGNLKALQEFYLSAGEDLDRVSAALDANPPRPSELDRFDALLNQFKVRFVGSTNPSGLPKTREEVAEEIDRTTFDIFTFSDLPGLYVVVFPEFLSANTPLDTEAKRQETTPDQIAVRIIWYGSINADSANLSKMRLALGLSGAQIRVGSFGDDLAVVSSSFFNDLLTSMEAKMLTTGLSPKDASTTLKPVDDLIAILDSVLKDANVFLAQLSFGTTLIEDSDVLEDAQEGGVSDPALEEAFRTRDDSSFRGADLNANELRTTVFPETSNQAERAALAVAFQQDPDSLRFTNKALNDFRDPRDVVELESRELVASIEARKLVIQRPNATSLTITQALRSVMNDIGALRFAYRLFLNPPTDPVRKSGTRTTESANNLLTRSTNLLKSLRIADQLDEFPPPVTTELAGVFSALKSILASQNLYLSLYRDGPMRDFLAAVVSVSSTTTFLLADGDPTSSEIVTQAPALIDRLGSNIQTVILDDPDSQVLYNNVSLQVGALAAVLRGNSTDDPVGRLFELPVTILDALLPSETAPGAFSLQMTPDQEEALRQVRESFAVLRTARGATTRDLSIYGPSFGCAITDARFFVARLAGESVSNLVAELG